MVKVLSFSRIHLVFTPWEWYRIMIKSRRLPWPLSREPLVKAKQRTLFRPSAEKGAQTSIHCAMSKDVLDHRGAYYSVMKLKEPSPVAPPELAAELWARSEEWTAG